MFAIADYRIFYLLGSLLKLEHVLVRRAVAMEAAVSQVEMEAAVWLLRWRQQYSGCSGGSSSAVAVGATV